MITVYQSPFVPQVWRVQVKSRIDGRIVTCEEHINTRDIYAGMAWLCAARIIGKVLRFTGENK